MITVKKITGRAEEHPLHMPQVPPECDGCWDGIRESGPGTSTDWELYFDRPYTPILVRLCTPCKEALTDSLRYTEK